MGKKLLLATFLALPALLLSPAAEAICESGGTHWACVSVSTSCSFSMESWQYSCSNDQATGWEIEFSVTWC